MSWTVAGLGDPHIDAPDYEPPPLGSAAKVRDRVSACLPGVDWSDPTWGLYAGDGFTFEFNIGGEEPVLRLAVHVRGGGDAIADLMRFVVPNGWHLLDGSTGQFIDPASPSADGWEGWQAYRDKIRRTGD